MCDKFPGDAGGSMFMNEILLILGTHLREEDMMKRSVLQR